MHYFLYTTFKPILSYVRGFDPQTCVHQDVCKRPNSFGVFLDVDMSHLSLGHLYALRSLGFDLPCHVPMPPTGKEDATKSLIRAGLNAHEHVQA